MFERELEALEKVPLVGPYWAFMARLQLSVLDAVNLTNLHDVLYPDTPEAQTPAPVATLETAVTDPAPEEDLPRAA